ncbi:hypothetical protein B0H11DRAFT_1987136 [Mycena galericulata]|nr:hypothetical protein B0H11DRAFT_1987136 [Mycena galericulata]
MPAKELFLYADIPATYMVVGWRLLFICIGILAYLGLCGAYVHPVPWRNSPRRVPSIVKRTTNRTHKCCQVRGLRRGDHLFLLFHGRFNALSPHVSEVASEGISRTSDRKPALSANFKTQSYLKRHLFVPPQSSEKRG